jgi:nucleoside-diphosphate-sugar epimerase
VFDPGLIRRLVTPGRQHLPSWRRGLGRAERDFDLGYASISTATAWCSRLRVRSAAAPRVVFASSLAAYGGDLPETITDEQKLTPQTFLRRAEGGRRSV